MLLSKNLGNYPLWVFRDYGSVKGQNSGRPALSSIAGSREGFILREASASEMETWSPNRNIAFY